MRFDGLLELKRLLDGARVKPVLVLKEVTHVDLEVVHFPGRCAQEGSGGKKARKRTHRKGKTR
jgi:hypothetical protein